MEEGKSKKLLKELSGCIKKLCDGFSLPEIANTHLRSHNQRGGKICSNVKCILKVKGGDKII